MQGVRKQSKKTILFLQISPRMTNLRQGELLVSFFFFFSVISQVVLNGICTTISIKNNVTVICDSCSPDMNLRPDGMRNTELEETQAGQGEISITSDMQMTSPLWQKAK